MSLQHSFPYYGSYRSLAQRVVEIAESLEPEIFVDPFAGGCKVPYNLAIRGIPIAVSDIHPYCAVSARAILTNLPLPAAVPEHGVEPYEGAMSDMASGYFTDEIRQVFDGILRGAYAPLQAAVAKALYEYAYGWTGWVKQVGLQAVEDVPVHQVIRGINRALSLYARRRHRVPREILGESIITSGDADSIVPLWVREGVIQPGALVLTAPTGIFRSTEIIKAVGGTEEIPFGFYTEIDRILLQDASFEPQGIWSYNDDPIELWDRLQGLLKLCLDAGASVGLEKATFYAPHPPPWTILPEPTETIRLESDAFAQKVSDLEGGSDECDLLYLWRQ